MKESPRPLRVEWLKLFVLWATWIASIVTHCVSGSLSLPLMHLVKGSEPPNDLGLEALLTNGAVREIKKYF